MGTQCPDSRRAQFVRPSSMNGVTTISSNAGALKARSRPVLVSSSAADRAAISLCPPAGFFEI
eukprot:scaffold163649_cov23-Prasinocladus_malaysianus.AAC.1